MSSTHCRWVGLVLTRISSGCRVCAHCSRWRMYSQVSDASALYVGPERLEAAATAHLQWVAALGVLEADQLVVVNGVAATRDVPAHEHLGLVAEDDDVHPGRQFFVVGHHDEAGVGHDCNLTDVIRAPGRNCLPAASAWSISAARTEKHSVISMAQVLSPGCRSSTGSGVAAMICCAFWFSTLSPMAWATSGFCSR